MPFRASIIAYAFVKKGIEQGIPVTQMKLQKMVYFAHGLHLALYNQPLIQERFQAWKYGPVVGDIYTHYKLYGSRPISDLGWLLLPQENLDRQLQDLDPEAWQTIDYTWNLLKEWNAVQLSNWTHKKGSPWDQVFQEGVPDIVIPNEEIERYFKQFLVA